jgi:outer membrane receptor protein involved in Fe transport
MAQTSEGRILGTVLDQSGAVVGSAKVTITNTATGTSRTITTTAAGDYAAPNLEPGSYVVTVESPGFQKAQHTAIKLEVAKDVRVDFKLTPGAISETMTVSGEAPMVDTTSDVLGGTFSNQAINELPLQGRDFQNLAILQPGVQRTPGGGFESITANGNRPQDNNFIIEGIDDNDAYYGVTVINDEGVQGTPATHLPIDAIQEFNIQSSPEADYGFKPGAIINIGIKSGTNMLHGSAYYFNRNAATDARNWFNPAPDPVAALNLHQFGASLGGPIVKNKLFIFGNYEGVRDKVGNPLVVTTPISVSTGDPSSSIVDAFAECAASVTNPCSAISQKLAAFLPFNPGPSNTLNLDYNNFNREDNGIVKLDYHLSEKHMLTGMYFVGDSVQTEEDSTVLNPLFLSQAFTRAQVVGGAWIWTPTARLTNQFHIGYNRFSQQVVVADHNLDSASLGIDTGVTNPRDFGIPEIRISGFESHTIGGNGSWPLYTTPNQTLQFANNTTYALGAHNLRFGAEFRTGSTNNVRDTYGPGYVRFNTDGPPNKSPLENFTTGDAGYAYVAVGDSHRLVSQKSFGAYIQDDWRVSPRLTVTAGLRYDLSLPITDQHDQLANFDPTRGLVQVGKQISSPYNTDYNNFGPRLGFAYDLFGTGRTVLRAGAGIIYEIPHITVYIGQNSTQAQGLALIPTGLPLIGDNGTVYPSPGNINATTATLTDTAVSANWKAGGPIFGNLSPGGVSCAYDITDQVDTPCPVFGVNRNIATPYVINWNLNIQQALWHDAVLTVAYVANKGVKLYSIRDINQNVYANDSQGDEQSGRPFVNQFPYLSFIDMLGNGDNSMYHGLQVTVRQNTHKGLYIVAGYTWAHSIDDASGNREFTIQDSNNPAAERGNSDTDIRHRFTMAVTYELPSRPGYAQLLRGWRINSIFTAQTGEPLLFYDSSDDISGTGEFNDRWNLSGDPSKIHWSQYHPLPFYPDGTTNPACLAVPGADPGQLAFYGCFAGPGWEITPPSAGQFGNMGRNVVYGPGYLDMDFSIIKNFTFGERAKLELRGEFFNVLNHPNFAGVDTDLSDGFSTNSNPLFNGTVGQAFFTPDIAASNPVVGSGGSRHIQLGAKIIW